MNSKLQSLSGVTKVVIALSGGAILAGAIALGASRGGGGSAPPAQLVADTATSVPEPTSTATPSKGAFVYPNYISPDAAALQRAAQLRAESDARGERCAAGHILFDSKLLNGSLCYPPTWKLVFGDTTLPPKTQRSEGFAYYLRIAKTDTTTGREVAHVSVQIVGSRPFTLLDCPTKGGLAIGAIQGQACFHQRNGDRFNTIQNGIARLIGIEVPRALEDVSAIWIGIQLADVATSSTEVRFSPNDQEEALGIVSSIVLNP